MKERLKYKGKSWICKGEKRDDGKEKEQKRKRLIFWYFSVIVFICYSISDFDMLFTSVMLDWLFIGRVSSFCFGKGTFFTHAMSSVGI